MQYQRYDRVIVSGCGRCGGYEYSSVSRLGPFWYQRWELDHHKPGPVFEALFQLYWMSCGMLLDILSKSPVAEVTNFELRNLVVTTMPHRSLVLRYDHRIGMVHKLSRYKIEGSLRHESYNALFLEKVSKTRWHRVYKTYCTK